jgi:NADH-quinone oxidoreductase subunit E
METTQVRGLVGFYSLLMDKPHGGWVIHLCTDLPCALMGAEDFREVLEELLGCRAGTTSDDGLFTLHECMCLGACDRAPLMQVNLEYFYDLTRERLAEIVDDLRSRAESDLKRRPPFGFGPPSDIAGGRS